MRIVLFLIMGVAVVAGVCFNVSAFSINSASGWGLVPVVGLVFFGAGIVGAVSFAFGFSKSHPILWFFAVPLLIGSCLLSFNSGNRLVSGFEGTANERQLLMQEKANLISSLDECRAAKWCDSQAKERRIADISESLASMPSQMPISSESAAWGASALPFVIGFGPDLVCAAMALILGLASTKKEQPKTQQEPKKKNYSSNVAQFKKKLLSKWNQCKKKFRQVGTKRKKQEKNKGTETKKEEPKQDKTGTKSKPRKPRVPSKEEKERLKKAEQELKDAGVKVTVTSLNTKTGIHRQKITSWKSEREAKEIKRLKHG